jgi:hypothetical protein
MTDPAQNMPVEAPKRDLESVPDVRGYRPTMSEDGLSFIVADQYRVEPEKFWAFVWWLDNRHANPRLNTGTAAQFSGMAMKEFVERCEAETGYRWTQIASWRRLDWFRALESEVLGDKINDFRHSLTDLNGAGARALKRVFEDESDKSFNAKVSGVKLLTEIDNDPSGPVIKKKQDALVVNAAYYDNRDQRVALTVQEVRAMAPEDITEWVFSKKQPKVINPEAE